MALPAGDHGVPAAAATGLPPVSSYVPIPLAEAASAHLSPPPTTDPKPLLGPSGFGLPVRRRARRRTAASPLPQPLLPGTPASGGAAPDPLGYSERVHTAAAPPAAGVGAVAGVAGTVAAPAAVTPGVEPLGRPLGPAVVPAAGAEVVAWVAEPVAASVSAPPRPQLLPLPGVRCHPEDSVHDREQARSHQRLGRGRSEGTPPRHRALRPHTAGHVCTKVCHPGRAELLPHRAWVTPVGHGFDLHGLLVPQSRRADSLQVTAQLLLVAMVSRQRDYHDTIMLEAD